jgi:hypothetical protein
MRDLIAAQLTKAKERSVAVYLRRQQIQADQYRLQQLAQQVDQELVHLDGEIAVCERLLAEPPHA